MFKKLVCLVLFICALLIPVLSSHAESGMGLRHNEKIFSAEQAALPESGFPFAVSKDGDTIILFDKESEITAEASHVVMDESMKDALRSYYNDPEASSDVLFSNLVGLSESYIDAALENYKMNFLYGAGGKSGSEANMKLFAKDSQVLFGHSSDVFVYNTLTAADSKISEKTHIDIFVPVKSSYSILNVSFTIKSSNLTGNNIKIINNMLQSIYFEGLSAQKDSLELLGSNTFTASVNSGIYPSSISPDTNSNILVEPAQGFLFQYPDSLVQYMQNSFISDLYYNSFKVSPDEMFSITVENTFNPDTVVADKVVDIKRSFGSHINIITEGTTVLGGKDSVYLVYSVSYEGTTSYFEDYLSVNNGKFYRLKFESHKGMSSETALIAFSEVFTSFRFITNQSFRANTLQNETVKYLDENTGLSFEYPKAWELTSTAEALPPVASFTSSDSARDENTLKLNLPEISDFLDIYISEGKNISVPFLGMPSTMLTYSIRSEGTEICIYKLVNYMDSGNKGRLCSCIDIINNGTICSMIIDVNSSWVDNGKISDPEIAAIVNRIAASFRLE